MKCPKCASNLCKLESEKETTGKDYSTAWGFIGELLFGATGFALGFSDGRKTSVDVYWRCQKCNHRFEA